MDKDAIHQMTGTPGMIGCNWNWVGDTLGTGGMTLNSFENNKSIVSRLIFTAPQAMESDDIWTFNTTDMGVKVVWTTANELSWPINRLFGLLLDGMIGPQMEKGLINLKEYCTKADLSELISIRFDVKGMTCEGCENSVKTAIMKINGIEEVTASHVEEEVCISFVAGTIDLHQVTEAITATGFIVNGEKNTDKQNVDKKDSAL
ncbi:MAG: cation transporter [Bacteroidales bacterium]|nr:cation transporter [Bacteroidales bacterium]